MKNNGQNIDSILKENINEYSEEDPENMKKTICSTPTRHMKMKDLDQEEIQEKIDALNLHYDQTVNTEKENSHYSANDFMNKNVNFQEKIENCDSININEILYNSIKKENKIGKQQFIEMSKGKEDINLENTIENKADIKVNIDVDINNNSINSIKNSVNSNPEFIEKKSSSSNVNTSHHVNRISDLEVINQDHYLKPFESKIKERIFMMNKLIKDIEKNESSLLEFSQGFKKIGFNVTDEGIVFREYAPGAKSISLVNIFFNSNN